MPGYPELSTVECVNTQRIQTAIMTPSLLPPRGCFIPSEIIFNLELSPQVVLTWIQLYALAWDGFASPALFLLEIAMLTGKSQSTLTRHLSILKDNDLLTWRHTDQGKIVISFPTQQQSNAEGQSVRQGSPTSKAAPINGFNEDASSYFPERILGYLPLEDID